MRITCPHCGFAKEIAEDKIPANVVKVNCPDCKQPFPLTREETLESGPTIEDVATYAVATSAPVDNAAMETEPTPYGMANSAETEAETVQNVSVSDETESGTLPEPTQSEPVCDEHVEAAGIGARYAALLIDSMIILFMVLILQAGLALLGNGVPAEGQILLGLTFMLFALTLGFAYHTLFIGACGQTPGKILLRIRVIQTDQSEMTYKRAMLREVFGKTLSTPLLLGYLMALFHHERLAAHDKIADTRVVKFTNESPSD